MLTGELDQILGEKHCCYPTCAVSRCALYGCILWFRDAYTEGNKLPHSVKLEYFFML